MEKERERRRDKGGKERSPVYTDQKTVVINVNGKRQRGRQMRERQMRKDLKRQRHQMFQMRLREKEMLV